MSGNVLSVSKAARTVLAVLLAAGSATAADALSPAAVTGSPACITSQIADHYFRYSEILLIMEARNDCPGPMTVRGHAMITERDQPTPNIEETLPIVLQPGASGKVAVLYGNRRHRSVTGYQILSWPVGAAPAARPSGCSSATNGRECGMLPVPSVMAREGLIAVAPLRAATKTGSAVSGGGAPGIAQLSDAVSHARRHDPSIRDQGTEPDGWYQRDATWHRHEVTAIDRCEPLAQGRWSCTFRAADYRQPAGPYSPYKPERKTPPFKIATEIGVFARDATGAWRMPIVLATKLSQFEERKRADAAAARQHAADVASGVYDDDYEDDSGQWQRKCIWNCVGSICSCD